MSRELSLFELREKAHYYDCEIVTRELLKDFYRTSVENRDLTNRVRELEMKLFRRRWWQRWLGL